jgi:broad specificity phosphatase PhoE
MRVRRSLAHQLESYPTGNDAKRSRRDDNVLKICESLVPKKADESEYQVLQLKESLHLRWSATAAETVVSAWYGNPEHAAADTAKHGLLCTDAVKTQLRASDRVVVTNDSLGSDPCPGKGKVLLVTVASGPDCLPKSPEDLPKPKLFRQMPQCDRWVAFVRHAQAGHNADPALLDRPDNMLTEFGRSQAQEASVGPAGAALRASELVVTSPLRRAMQTTGLLLGGEAGRVPRVRVDALVTERAGATCDQGTPKSVLLSELPLECSAAWEGWSELPETWWPEKGEDMWGRAEAFKEMVRRRPEDRLTFVGHGAFFQMVLGEYLPNCEVIFCNRDLL